MKNMDKLALLGGGLGYAGAGGDKNRRAAGAGAGAALGLGAGVLGGGLYGVDRMQRNYQGQQRMTHTDKLAAALSAIPLDAFSMEKEAASQALKAVGAPLGGLYTTTAAKNVSNPQSFASHATKSPSSFLGSGYEVADLTERAGGWGLKSLAKLPGASAFVSRVPWARPAAGAMQRIGGAAGRMAVPLWATQIAAQGAEHMFKDPSTGKWNMDIGGNTAANDAAYNSGVRDSTVGGWAGTKALGSNAARAAMNPLGAMSAATGSALEAVRSLRGARTARQDEASQAAYTQARRQARMRTSPEFMGLTRRAGDLDARMQAGFAAGRGRRF